MKIEVPYYKQSTQYTCGPTALKMVLEHVGIQVGDDELTRLMRCSAEKGTENSNFYQTLTQLGLACREMTNMTFDALQEFIEKNTPVLVNYRNVHDNRGHFAVAIGVEGKEIIFNDPEYGADYRIARDVFEKQWISHDGVYRRWACIIAAHDPFSTADTSNISCKLDT